MAMQQQQQRVKDAQAARQALQEAEKLKQKETERQQAQAQAEAAKASMHGAANTDQRVARDKGRRRDAGAQHPTSSQSQSYLSPTSSQSQSVSSSSASTHHHRQGKSHLLPPAPPYYPIPRGKSILGVIYGVLLWADMNAATPLGAWGRSVISLDRCTRDGRDGRGKGSGSRTESKEVNQAIAAETVQASGALCSVLDLIVAHDSFMAPPLPFTGPKSPTGVATVSKQGFDVFRLTVRVGWFPPGP